MPDQPASEAITARLRTLTGRAGGGGAAGLAKRLGLEPWNVRRYVRGDTAPPHDFLAQVADYFGVTLDYIYGREGKPPRTDPDVPAWAVRMDGRLDFLERKLDELSENALSTEEIVRIAVDAARPRRRSAVTSAGSEAPRRSVAEREAAAR